MRKPKVLFVGSFKSKSRDSSTGGQSFACTSLVLSSLNQKVEWLKLDTTAQNKERLFITRMFQALKRIILFVFKIIFLKPDYILLFAANGWSFREKGLLASIGKSFNKTVIFAPRSGVILKDIERNHKFKSIITKTLNNIDVLICQSNFWKSFYSKYNENGSLRMKIIQNWVDINNYKNTKSKVSSPRKYCIFFLGWVVKNKGILDLVKAINLVDHDVELHIGGDGNQINDVKKLATKYGISDKIKLHGWVHASRKFELLKKADLFVLPSYFEGYPNSIIEAMASKIPVLASDIPSIKEIIKHKKNGYLCKSGDPSSIAEGISWYFENPELSKQIGINGYNHIVDNNTIDSVVKNFSDVFEFSEMYRKKPFSV